MKPAAAWSAAAGRRQIRRRDRSAGGIAFGAAQGLRRGQVALVEGVADVGDAVDLAALERAVSVGELLKRGGDGSWRPLSSDGAARPLSRASSAALKSWKCTRFDSRVRL